ncbi:MAG: serine/threonine-protein kinase [Sandaracinaceae bacterium]
MPADVSVSQNQLLGDRYRVGKRLGAGGMGVVFQGVDERLDRPVAIKVLGSTLADEPVYVERFRREASAAAQLGSPHIVQVTDFAHGSGPREPSYIVMELLEGESLLERLIRVRTLAPESAIRVMIQVLDALEVAHAAGIVHRDLKPGNVFLVPLADGELVKLLDFGIARLEPSRGFARLTADGDMIGTPRYAAPEQLAHADVDGRTDVFAAGGLLYGVLCGRPPFDGQGTLLMRQVMMLDPPPLEERVSGLDPRLVEVVRRAMQKAPEDRYDSARAMRDALVSL